MNLLTRVLTILILVLLSAQLTRAEEPALRVAVFEGEGVGPSSNQLIAALTEAKGRKLDIFRISTEEIRSGRLQGVDVLVHPGGSGGQQGRTLGDAGRKAIREYVRKGCGFLGVCAGAYLERNGGSLEDNRDSCIDSKGNSMAWTGRGGEAVPAAA